MSEIADAVLAGELCEVCGEYLPGEAFGFPRICDGCQGESRPRSSSAQRRAMLAANSKTRRRRALRQRAAERAGAAG